jgi:hypothetical protein
MVSLAIAGMLQLHVVRYTATAPARRSSFRRRGVPRSVSRHARVHDRAVQFPVVYERNKKALPDRVPDHLITPQELPGMTFTIDG